MPRSRRFPVSTDRRFRKNKSNSDYGPPERWQHSGRVLEFTEKAGVLAARATEEHVVDILVLRGVLNPQQADAAFKLKLDFQRAGLSAHIIGSYSGMHSPTDFFRGKPDRCDVEEAAYQRWRNAMRALGLTFSNAVVTVVCQDLLPTPRDIVLLPEALDRVAVCYGLKRGGG